MSAEFSPDHAFDKSSYAASYSAEFLRAHQELEHQLRETKDKVIAADAIGQLPDGASLTDYPEAGILQIVFGDLPKDFRAAMAARRAELETADKVMKADTVVVSYFSGRPENELEALLGIDQPQYKIEWGSTYNGQSSQLGVELYADGYAEASSSMVYDEMVHPDDANEMTRRYAEPAVKRTVDVQPPSSGPATETDLANASQQLQAAVAHYSL